MVAHKVQAMLARRERNTALRERLVIQLAGTVWQKYSEQADVVRDAAWREAVAQECIKVADALIHELDKRNQEQALTPAARLEDLRERIIREHEHLGRTQGRLNELQAEARRLEAQLDSQP